MEDPGARGNPGGRAGAQAACKPEPAGGLEKVVGECPTFRTQTATGGRGEEPQARG